MRLLFSVNNFGFLRNFEPALRLLAARGHDIHLVAERKDSVGGTKTIDNLTREHPDRITFSYAPSRKGDAWQPLATQLRLALDYWRYLDARYDQSPSLRARAERQAPPLAAHIARSRMLGGAARLRLWRRLGRWLERGLPPGATVESFLRDRNPDLLLITPLLYFGSQQVEYVRAARTLGIPTVLGVGSWDHLTTKGLIHELPDRVVVWNEAQRREAAELHGVPPERVVVTGAQAYDHWFAARPTLSREAFCAKVGVPADRPLLLYLCSSPFITPYEVGFVRRWIESIRMAADPALRGASILIRPHPQNAGQWSDFDPGQYDAVGIWPRAGANPVDAEARADYYDSMFHSVAVVGVNTSALIESGIVGRPVYTVITAEFAGQQEGTLHFQHLKNVNGGLLTVGATLDEHVAQLAVAVNGGHDAAKSRAFVEAFVRPHGIESPAAERFVAAVEEAASPRPSPQPARGASIAVRRLLLRPLATAARAAASRRSKQRRADADATERGPLTIVFAIASPEFLRYYDSTMRYLADRGHKVSVAVSWLRERKHARMELMEDARIEAIGQVPKRGDWWATYVHGVRATQDFLRYLHPRFANTPMLRQRVYRKVLPAIARPLNRFETLDDRTIERGMRALQQLERVAPVSRAVTQFVSQQRPDVMVVSPLIDAASDQVDLVRACQRTGTPVIAAIASWDNLTNKGHMRVYPDLVTVWNEHQRTEAIELHGVDPDRIRVTGAQLFDRWFERQPSLDRQAFCRQVGLPEDRPFVLFTGSSVFIARSDREVPFVRTWIAAMRASDSPVLRDAAVLVRPHPFNPDAWITADFSDLGPVAVFPRERYTPAAEEARSSFFDSLYHCDAVVGINTSAMIEAAILRKPVLSLLTPEFAGTQEGTIHFRYLLPENGGFLRVANAVDAHLVQLDEVLRDPEATRAQTERFVQAFLRPHGLNVPCTPILAGAIEQVGRAGARPRVTDTLAARLMRIVIFPLAVLSQMLDVEGGIRRRTWSVVYESYDFTRKYGRLALKRMVSRPRRAVSQAVILSSRAVRRWGRLSVRAIAGGVRRVRRTGRLLRHRVMAVARLGVRAARHVVRLGRQLRYQVGLRLRGANGGGMEGGDGQ